MTLLDIETQRIASIACNTKKIKIFSAYIVPL